MVQLEVGVVGSPPEWGAPRARAKGGVISFARRRSSGANADTEDDTDGGQRAGLSQSIHATVGSVLHPRGTPVRDVARHPARRADALWHPRAPSWMGASINRGRSCAGRVERIRLDTHRFYPIFSTPFGIGFNRFRCLQIEASPNIEEMTLIDPLTTPHTPSEEDPDAVFDALLVEADADPEARAVYDDTLRRLRLRSSARATRTNRALTQTQVAGIMGTTQSAVSDLESGRVDAQLRTWQRYGRAIGKAFAFSFEDVDDSSGIPSRSAGRGQTIPISSMTLSPLLTNLHLSDAGQAASTISAATGLPEPLVIRVLTRLQEVGWTQAEGEGEARAFTLVDDVANVIGISLHRDRIIGVLVDMNGELSDQPMTIRITESTPEVVIETAGQIVNRLFSMSDASGKRVLGVGVSLAGIVDAESGRVDYAPDLQSVAHGWRGVELERDLQALIQHEVHGALRVGVENDVNALAAWEYHHHHPNESMAVVLMSGGGIGAGIMVDGKVVRGARSAAGEVGHLIVDHASDAPECRAEHKHRGCLETVATVQGILRRLNIPASTLALRTAGLEAANTRVENGDPDAHEAFFDAGRHLGEILPLLRVLDPERIVIYASPYLHKQAYASAAAFQAGVSAALTDADNRGATPVGQPPPDWHTLQEHTGAQAAASAVLLNHFFNEPAHWYPGLEETVERNSELVLA